METLIDHYYNAGHKYNAISFYITFFIQSITKCFAVSINCKRKQRERKCKDKISLTIARGKRIPYRITQIKVQFSRQTFLQKGIRRFRIYM